MVHTCANATAAVDVTQYDGIAKQNLGGVQQRCQEPAGATGARITSISFSLLCNTISLESTCKDKL